MSDILKGWLIPAAVLALTVLLAWLAIVEGNNERQEKMDFVAKHKCKVTEFTTAGFFSPAHRIWSCDDGNKYTFDTIPTK